MNICTAHHCQCSPLPLPPALFAMYCLMYRVLRPVYEPHYGVLRPVCEPHCCVLRPVYVCCQLLSMRACTHGASPHPCGPVLHLVPASIHAGLHTWCQPPPLLACCAHGAGPYPCGPAHMVPAPMAYPYTCMHLNVLSNALCGPPTPHAPLTPGPSRWARCF